jgi:hypothetical protein
MDTPPATPTARRRNRAFDSPRDPAQLGEP